MPFEPGKSGNPARMFSKENQPARKGRPKELPALRELLVDVLGEQINDLTAIKAILYRLRKMAIDGNLKAAELLLNHAYGKPKESIDHTSDGQAIRPPAVIVFEK